MAGNVNFRSSLEMRRDYAVEIIEQPAPKLQRFRYASEVDGSRSVGSIPGVHSTAERKTYPTIRVRGYNGPMMVMLSLVNPDDDRVHPHAVTGNDPRYRCTNGVIYTFVDGPQVSFNNVGILCVKSKTDLDVTAALRERQKVKIDPFKAGFDHIDDRSLINFNAVRLCFTVYIPEGEIKPHDRRDWTKYNINLTPVASTVVYDAKKLNELKIQYVNKSIGSMLGGTEIVILCEKYAGPHPEIVFVEGDWEEKAQITQYHKQMALVAVTPPYRDPFCARSVPVEVYLQRVSPRGVLERSAPASSEYIPVLPKSHPSEIGIKRPPRGYIDTKKRKRPFTEHLSKYIQSTDVTGNNDVMDMLIQCFGPSPSITSNPQSFAEIAGSSNNAQVQQDNMCQPHSTSGTSNSFNQQVNSAVDCIDPSLYTNINATPSSFNQKIDSDPQKPILTLPYLNSFDPLTPDGPNKPLVHGDPLTTSNANYTNILENNTLQEGAIWALRRIHRRTQYQI
ncbi:hypothetical protein MSG28_006589 [Choristoneura fumiferana]|uniref:Uncharacterized protein n=1 Tax=Choristoneura fumiferana TaxID=7141 RepID=A0ACC0JFG6_CHOFU|nr:hypothetical protein MSG28_006589 [Choristoneura fumiferana]